MSAKFDKIKEYIHNRKVAFSVIAISEVWLSEDQVNLYQLEGYDNYCQIRTEWKGGGVRLFIKKSLEHHIVENMTMSLNEMECLTVEVCVNGQSVNITCVYRVPSTRMKTFNDIMYDKIVNQFSNKKSLQKSLTSIS